MRQKGRACRQAPYRTGTGQAGIVGIFVLVLVLVVAVAGGAYYLGRTTTKPQVTETNQATPTTPLPSKASATEGDPTANWQTYTDTDGKYSIKYPDDYFLKEETSLRIVDDFPPGKRMIVIEPSEKLNFFIYINYYLIPDVSQADEALEKIMTCDRGKVSKDFIIDGQKAIMYEDGCAQFSAANFYILHNDYVYTISVPSTKQYGLHKAEVEKILSTFKFTSQ